MKRLLLVSISSVGVFFSAFSLAGQTGCPASCTSCPQVNWYNTLSTQLCGVYYTVQLNGVTPTYTVASNVPQNLPPNTVAPGAGVFSYTSTTPGGAAPSVTFSIPYTVTTTVTTPDTGRCLTPNQPCTTTTTTTTNEICTVTVTGLPTISTSLNTCVIGTPNLIVTPVNCPKGFGLSANMFSGNIIGVKFGGTSLPQTAAMCNP